MLASSLGRNVSDGALQDLEQSLLYTFARNIAGDGGVLVFATDLVYFIDVDDAGLSASYVAFGSLQQLKDDVLYVFADVTRFREGSCIHDGERNIQHAGQGLRQQRLARAGGADQHDVRLG